jgi:hypothetical protein
LPQKGGVTRHLHPEMSQTTRKEILKKMQVRYGRAGQEYKSKLIDEVVELFGYHRKAAIRALGRPVWIGPLTHLRWPTIIRGVVEGSVGSNRGDG